MQTFAIIVSLAITAVAVVMATIAVRSIYRTVRIGGPAMNRSDQPGRRTWTLVKESLGHTRMLQWHWVGIMHWFVYAGFIVLSGAVATGYFQLFDPEFALPLIGHFFLYEWVSEGLGLLSTVGIVFLIVYRQLNHPRRKGRGSRFYGSNFWQAYFVEAMALLEGSAILFIRGAEYNLGQIASDHPEDFDRFHFPISSLVGDALFPAGVEGNEGSLETIIIVIAMIKILLAMTWLIVISSNLTMGVAWHRFTAWPNIWFKREGSGRTALGGMKPLTSDGKAITLDDIDDLDEDSKLGVGAIEDFSWKGILDFTTCTECGRCQSQCPAWNTEKPLSPKLLITALRDHAYAKAPYLQAEGDEAKAALLEGNDTLTREVERPLVGETGGRMDGLEDGEWFYNPENGAAVIDPDVLWNCTSCGACVQQCPVDIEHVDHIMDMRRHQVLVESNFPAELNGLFKGLENKGNPWNMSPNARMDWTKGLDFEVKVVGETVESLDEVDWLFWVGCAGAYEDRAKKTTRAVAELLDIAGVSFGVLGNGETCTGDPARRAGNEFVFQGLAQQNVEVFKEYKVKKVVSTCAHCFNTLKNEYKEFGVELEVVHHTQLLNRLVREGKLTPVKDGAGAHQRKITYHDPCYIGRHNGVYTPPRELLQILPGAEVVEMERNSERSFCCGAGGARMWMEENLGERINLNRTVEAVGTGADQIAVGCPFCRVMLSDGLTAQQAKGEAREEVEVLDVAQMLLASVKGEMATKAAPGSSATAAPEAKAAPAPAEKPVETKAEPEAGDETITEDTVVDTEDAGPAAKASGGSSLFDDASSMFDEPEAKAAPATATEEKEPAEEAQAAKPTSSGGSLFDLGGDEAEPAPADEPAATAEPTPEPEKKAERKAEPSADLGSGGSLFDLGGDEPEPAAKAEPEPAAEPTAAEPAAEKAEAKPAADLGSGGSLFDIQADEPAEPAASSEPEPAEEPPAAPEPKAEPAVDLGSGGSLFDIAAPAPVTAPEPAAPAQPVDEPEPEAEVEPKATPEPEPAAEADAAPAAATTTRAATPATGVDFDSLGSLFDLEAPEPVAAPAAKAEPEPEAEATPEPEPEPEPEAQAEPEPEAASEPEPQATSTPVASSALAATPATDVDFDSLDSLFDIEAPEPVTAPAAKAEAQPQAQAEPEPEPETTAEAEPEAEPAAESAAESESPGADLSAAATAAASDEPETTVESESEPVAEKEVDPEPEPAEPEAAAEPQSEEKPEEKPRPASSGEAHQPKTDVDIHEASSLFDL
ncbi:(Fe-S)-binding protein [Nocardioides lianchengensis]|uniref:Fe-S oxidoreductase n=1 Tax=Nocardioides lianchengensis TaxID=1045774 RepID=A0A1G7ADP9_9ACTN|nr:(Fe-S)-binding protein [Nocardioides lianchengensis]NYG13615.1 Fe-S oxidoreductase [Nocardioides lianchengensis]SDE13054.1 Fe-S oxidoreductase [Nocardioides lianchengensis]